MKILCFTDLHGSDSIFEKIKEKSKKADLIIACGDISVFERDLSNLIKNLDNLGKRVFLIHGNHEDPSIMNELCKKTKNVVFIHKKVVRVQNCLIVGYGGGGFGDSDSEYEKFIMKAKKVFKKEDKLIFAFHGPPSDNKLDFIYGRHVGNKSYTKAIIKIQPSIALCGHLHENFNQMDYIGKTLLLNPGPRGKFVDL